MEIMVVAEESDPAVTEGHTTEAPEPDHSFGDIVDEYSPDTPSEEPEAPEGHTDDDAKSSETETVPDPLEQERGYMRQDDYSRKTADLAEERRALQAEREQIQREMQELRSQVQQAQQAPQVQAQTDDLQYMLNDPNLTPQERAGVQTILQIRQAQAELAQQIQEFQQFRETLEPQFQEQAQALQGLTRAQQEARAAEIRTQGQEAIRLFGEESVRANVGFIERNFGQINPMTAKPYTVAELTAMATGRSAEQAQEARNRNGTARHDAKAAASSNGSHPANVNTSTFTEADAIAEIAANTG